MRREMGLLLCTALLCLGLSGCAWLPDPFAGEEELTVLTIATADSGGTMYQVGSALAQGITQADESIKVNVGASTGSAMNVRELAEGGVDLALVSGDVARSAYAGEGEFDQPMEDLRAVAAVYSSVSTWMAPASVRAEYVHDLEGASAGVGPQDSSSELAARAAVEALGLDSLELVNCSLASAPERVDGRDLDAIHGFTGNPIPGLWELADARPCTVLRYEWEELGEILRRNSMYSLEIIPAGTYPGQEQDIETFGLKCLLCVDADLDEDLVYELTRILWENRSDLAEECRAMEQAAAQEDYFYTDLPIPLHPGAQRFYETLEG